MVTFVNLDSKEKPLKISNFRVINIFINLVDKI